MGRLGGHGAKADFQKYAAETLKGEVVPSDFLVKQTEAI